MTCPKCGRSKGVAPVGLSRETYWCPSCAMAFDGADPNEGGDYHDRDPSRRLEREESRKKQWPKRT